MKTQRLAHVFVAGTLLFWISILLQVVSLVSANGDDDKASCSLHDIESGACTVPSSAKEWTDSSEFPDMDQLSKNLESIEVRTLGVLDINSYPALVIPVRVPVGMDKENCTALVSAQIQNILDLI